MDKIFQNGVANSTEGIEMIDSKRLKEIEPFVEGIGGIYVPCTGIIDFRGATEKMAEIALSMQPKSALMLNHEVIGIERSDEKTIVATSKGNIEAKYLIFCAGLQADRLARKDGVKRSACNPPQKIRYFA